MSCSGEYGVSGRKSVDFGAGKEYSEALGLRDPSSFRLQMFHPR
jgi:hypothetical protein